MKTRSRKQATKRGVAVNSALEEEARAAVAAFEELQARLRSIDALADAASMATSYLWATGDDEKDRLVGRLICLVGVTAEEVERAVEEADRLLKRLRERRRNVRGH